MKRANRPRAFFAMTPMVLSPWCPLSTRKSMVMTGLLMFSFLRAFLYSFDASIKSARLVFSLSLSQGVIMSCQTEDIGAFCWKRVLISKRWGCMQSRGRRHP